LRNRYPAILPKLAEIDEIVVGDGSDSRRFIVTTSHCNEPLEEVLDLVSVYDAGPGAQVEQVRF